MKRIEIINTIMRGIIALVKEAYLERHEHPHKFKLRNHYISEAMGLLASLQVLHAYPFHTIVEIEHAIDEYDIYMLQHIANTAKILPYHKICGVKGGTDND